MKSQKKYKIGNKTFLYNESDLINMHETFCLMTDEEFMENILDILHFSIYVCFVKDLKTREILSDEGILHQLSHLTQEKTKKYVNVKEIRKNFDFLLDIQEGFYTFPQTN